MKRKLLKTAVGAVTVITTFVVTRKAVVRKQTEQQADYNVKRFDSLPSEPLPMFVEGDRLHIYNPHMGAIYQENYDLPPALYEVEGVWYDEEDDVFRYKLDKESDWISEEWLSLPFYSEFKKERGGIDDLSIKKSEIESAILGKALDDSAKHTQIDALLDVMIYGNKKEKAEAERVLTELTSN